MAGLVVIGVLDRPAFPTAALSFLAAFTLYILVRPITYPTATHAGGPSEAAVKHPWRWIIGLLVLGFLIVLAIIPGGEKLEFEVAGEFEREVLIELPTIGPFDLSITKTVAYLFIAVAVIVVLHDRRRALAQGEARAASSTPWRPCTSSPATASSARS